MGMTTKEILQGVHDWTLQKVVYDISAAHQDGQGNPRPYADLAAALDSNNGGGVPQSLQEGGMSVKFIQGTVQSSDNKYVQFGCMAQNFTTDVTQWQGVDEELKSESKNLAESGAVFRRCENTDIAIGVTISEDNKVLSASTIYRGNTSTSNNCLCNSLYIEVEPNKTYKLVCASDLKIRVAEYNENKQFVQDTGTYATIDTVTIGSTTKFVRIAADYSERGFDAENPISVEDYQVHDFAILLPTSSKIVEKNSIESWNNEIKASTVGAIKRFSVSTGSHSSNLDAMNCLIEAGRKVGIKLRNITTSNSGAASMLVLYEGDITFTSAGGITFDDDVVYKTFEHNVIAISFYWTATVGSTSGIVEVDVFYASSIMNRLNTIAYLTNGATFEWKEFNPTTIKFGNSLNIKHINGVLNFSISDLLDIASVATGFTVYRDNNSIKFPIIGTMYFDTEARTVGFINNTSIADDSRYIVLFAAHYQSARYGLLVDYALGKNHNNTINAIDKITSLSGKYDLSVDGVHVVSVTSSKEEKYYEITLKRGIYYIFNYGDAIDSFYLCSSVAEHDTHREITVGAIEAGTITKVECNLDDIVCIDGYWPKNTDFVICAEENLHSVFELIKQKRILSFTGNDETIVSKFIPVNKNSTYRIIPDRTTWPVATNTKSWPVVAFQIEVNGDSVYSKIIQRNASTFPALDTYIDVDIPNTNDIGCLKVNIRALSNEEVTFSVVDVTALKTIITPTPEEESTIFKTNPEEEFVPKVRTLKKQTPYGYSRVNTPLVFLWFSDLHHNLNNLERINLWKERYSSYVDDVLNTGDIIYDNLSSYDNDMDAYFEDYGGDKILLAMGNHDVTTPNSSYKAWDGTQSITDMYTKYIGRLDANALGITQPANAAANGYCYYYKDYVGLGISTSGIRLIVIDSCITDADYQTTQVAWFVETLAAAKTLGYDVIVASHYMPGGCDEFDDAKGFCYFVKQYRIGGVEQVDSRYATAIDDFIGEGGKFVTWLCGHEHADHVGTVPSHQNQMVIAITCATSNSYAPSAIQPVRAANTKTQDAFDHVEIDTYNKQVKLVRVGYNVDALGREINMITLDYQNKKVII